MYITVIITRIGKTFHRDKENYCIRELGTVMPNGCKHTYEIFYRGFSYPHLIDGNVFSQYECNPIFTAHKF
jgi:protein gp37